MNGCLFFRYSKYFRCLAASNCVPIAIACMQLPLIQSIQFIANGWKWNWPSIFPMLFWLHTRKICHNFFPIVDRISEISIAQPSTTMLHQRTSVWILSQWDEMRGYQHASTLLTSNHAPFDSYPMASLFPPRCINVCICNCIVQCGDYTLYVPLLFHHSSTFIIYLMILFYHPSIQ